MRKLIIFVLFFTISLNYGQVASGCGSTNWPSNVSTTVGSSFTVPAGSGTGWTYVWVVTPSLNIVTGQGTTTAVIRGYNNFSSGTVYVTRYKNGVSACADMKTVNIINPTCNYNFDVADVYIDQNQTGAITVGLNVTSGNTFPSGTTYAWTITRQDGTTQYYPPTTAQTRFVATSYDNRVIAATVVATYLNCTKTVIKNFRCGIPEADQYGVCFTDCGPTCQGGNQRIMRFKKDIPIKSGNNKEILVTPNPTTSIIKFQGEDLNNYKVSIFNIYGTEILKDSKIDQEINFEKQEKGIYFYIITDENGFKQEGKIIKE